MDNYGIIEFKEEMKKSGYSFSFMPLDEILKIKHPVLSPFNFNQIDFFLFILFTEGKENHVVDFKEYECKKGTLLALRKGQIHKFSNPKMNGCLLKFDYEFLGRFFTKAEAQKSLLLFNEFLYEPVLQLTTQQYNTLLIIVNQIKEEYEKQSDEFSASIIRSLLQVLVNEIYRIKTAIRDNYSNRKYLSQFIVFYNTIEENYTHTLKVKDYAHQLGWHPKTLNLVTRNVVNKNAKEFIDEVCIKNIKRLLVNSELSIKEIADQSGFEETTNFNNYFKKRVGETPNKFRQLKT